MLILGTDKAETILDTHPNRFLLIDDGPLLDAITFPKSHRLTRFDVATHSFNPLRGMDYLKARQFIEIIGAVFPQGENTLTKKNADFILLNALLAKTKTLRYLPDLIDTPDKKDTAALDAWQKIQTILLSPVLKNVLCNRDNFRSTGTILARLDRATLGDFDCFVLGNLLISAYKGHVIVPDFGFYACPFHVSLIRQGRLTAGLDFLSDLDRPGRQLDKLRAQLLSSEPTKLFQYNRTAVYTHHACRTSPEDAVTLARYAGLRPDPLREDNAYNAFIEECMA